MRKAFRQAASVFTKAAQAILALTVISGCSTTSVPSAYASSGKYAAIVVDANTGETLFSANADAGRYPASLTKMMTLYMLFEAMQAGRVNKNTPIPVSRYAASRPPTKLGLKPGQSVRAEDAIYGLITRSANDAATAVGEYLGGSEQRFAQMMTAKARRLGMKNTVFRNADGLPNASQRSSARDMAILGIALREHFPREFAYFSAQSFNYKGRTIRGHNRLLGKVQGVDGIKTGYTRDSGYNLVSSVKLDGRKVVAVVMGGASGGARDAHMASLIAKYLPRASRRGGEPLIAAQDTAPIAAPVQVTPVDLPEANDAPVPMARVETEEEVGQGDADDEVITALAAPAPRPAAAVAVASVARAPKAAIPAHVDPVTTASARSNDAQANSGWAIQIGSLPSSEQAQAMLAKAAAEAGQSLASVTARTETFEKKSKTFYRARFVGFETNTAALNACALLKKKNFNCFTIAN
ncbi:D-alanyl-D-alanine carboxypeptidase family protein [Phyllobacterium leguminum]|uniref:D-alanyl-D-alanine carboxypeptidase/D-alanyl-D-alanine carboxypeptidase (Penicillin-binding protein 5/6) n=1 Tax=Phyllobacterium leguminum TaxID=314237 RepID=A0A318T1J4_9HYPH|nr:D-alanyl-D-alanine carboxypeptidase family protein [Phyllobacterium leguminum]PYE88186.1 D-alanyl-D-alanine carboxypeptidase/D-alanyl-D-alanine carboxypeptidase (penicillin-binding protein 5/6) [Phyllobacterium leguminum]